MLFLNEDEELHCRPGTHGYRARAFAQRPAGLEGCLHVVIYEQCGPYRVQSDSSDGALSNEIQGLLGSMSVNVSI